MTCARSAKRENTMLDRTNPTSPKLRLVKFSSAQCPACAHMARSRVLERFIAAHPEVQLLALDCVNKDGETPTEDELQKKIRHGELDEKEAEVQRQFSRNYKLSDL